jgi:uncharacterized protein
MVFLKAPREGSVKTRLAAGIGARAAVEIYRQLAEQQLERIPKGWRVEVHYSPIEAGGEMRAWLGEHAFYPQRGMNLGERLTGAFDGCFARGASEAMAIGGDCPDLDGDALETASSALRKNDVVVGPALDGGYYLIGLRKPTPSLFQRIAWSTTDVLDQTRQRASEGGLSICLLPTKRDIDDVNDWRAYLAEKAMQRMSIPHEAR